MNKLDPFYLRQELNRINNELFTYRLQSQNSSRYTKDVDNSRAKVRELEAEELVIRTQLEMLDK